MKIDTFTSVYNKYEKNDYSFVERNTKIDRICELCNMVDNSVYLSHNKLCDDCNKVYDLPNSVTRYLSEDIISDNEIIKEIEKNNKVNDYNEDTDDSEIIEDIEKVINENGLINNTLEDIIHTDIKCYHFIEDSDNIHLIHEHIIDESSNCNFKYSNNDIIKTFPKNKSMNKKPRLFWFNKSAKVHGINDKYMGCNGKIAEWWDNYIT